MSNELRTDSCENQRLTDVLRAVVDAHSIISIVDPNGRIVEVNENFCNLCGYSRAELLGEDHRILSSGYHTARFWQSMWSEIEQGRQWKGAICNRSKSGELIWLDTTIVPTLDEKGRVREYVSVRHDISALKSSELRLGGVSQSLEQMSKIARIGTWDLDLLAGSLNWSEMTREIHEVPSSYVPDVKTAIHFYKEGEDRNRIQEIVERSVLDGGAWDVELRIITQKGREVWVRAIGQSEIKDGECIRLFGTFQDIDAEKRNQEALSEHSRALENAKNRLALAVRTSGVGIWDWDIVNDRMQWDEQMFALYSISSDSFEGSSKVWFNFLHSEDRARGRAAIDAAISGERELDFAFRIVWPDATVHHIRTLATVQRDKEGNAIRMIGTNWDVTDEVKKNEALVDLANQAKEAIAVKSEFIANMSHEIRTPLNGIIGMASLLLDSTSLDLEQRECSETISSCGDSLLTMVNDILDFSKARTGTLDQETVDFDLRDLLNDFVSTLIFQSKERELEIRCVVDPEVPSHVRGDAGRLRQILSNLGSNAIKFTYVGSVDLSVAMVSCNEAECVVKFSMRDTGVGVAEGDQPLLFDGFTQADASSTRNYGGMGLGLAISKQLAELMGGEIGMESIDRDGSEFWFTVNLGRQSCIEFSEDELKRLRAANVLLAISSEEERSTIEGLLASSVSAMRIANSGDAAIQLLNQSRTEGAIDLAIVEHDIESLEGIPVIESIRSCPDYSEMRLIVLSKMGDYGVDEQLEHHDVHTYVTKPVRESDLMERVVSAMTPKVEDSRKAERKIKDRFKGANTRILVAEDSPINQFIIKRLLKRIGLTADVAANGVEALKALESLPYDLVLMDVQMPEMDGLEATREIRRSDENCGYKMVPIVALTARALKEDRERCIEAGMDDYLSKPVTVKKLADILDKWVLSTESD